MCYRILLLTVLLSFSAYAAIGFVGVPFNLLYINLVHFLSLGKSLDDINIMSNKDKWDSHVHGQESHQS